MDSSASEGVAEEALPLERLLALSEASKTFAEASSEDEHLFEIIARKLSEVVKALSCVLVLSVDRESLEPVFVHASDAETMRSVREALSAKTFRLAEHPIIRRALQERTAALPGEADAVSRALSDAMGAVPCTSWVLLRAGGQALGIVAFARFGPGATPFDACDRKMAEILADHAALAFANARASAAERAARASAEQSEKARLASEAHHERMLANAAEAIVVTDAGGRISFANLLMEQVFGFEPGELVGLSVDALVPSPRREAHRKLREELASTPTQEPRGRDRAMVGLRKDGTEFPIEVGFSTTERDGCPVVLAFVSDITRREEADQKLREYQEKLRQMAFDTAVAEERERRRIAVDLHDRIGQTLALAQIKLSSVRDEVTGAPRAAIEAGVALVAQSIDDSRSLVFELSPPVLYDLGLHAALSWLAEEVERLHGLRVTLTDDDAPKPLDDTTAAFLFRAVRELLMNVLKHANVPLATVSLQRAGDELEVVVEDAGVGFDLDATRSVRSGGGFGLFSMREQIGRLGGTVEISSAKGRGTSVRARVRLKAH
jgi:PAS domain S-box-containing protein